MFVQELFVKLLWALFKAAAPLQGYYWKTKLKTGSIDLFDFGKQKKTNWKIFCICKTNKLNKNKLEMS